MNNLLSQLQSNEAVLLMYLADELPPKDRAEVDHLLQSDGAMRTQLQHLRDSLARLDDAMAAQGDQTFNVERAIQRTTAAMRQWRAEVAGRPALARSEASRLPLPWWCYPLAAAASIVVAAAVFFANRAPAVVTPGFQSRIVAVQPADLMASDAFSGLSLDPVEAHAVAEDLVATFDDSASILAGSADSGLYAATRQLQALRESSQGSLAMTDIAVQ